MKYLTLNEEILLLTIWRLGSEAYGVAIRDKYVETTGNSIVLGTMYNSLDYLVKKKYVMTNKGEPTPERGGKRKTYFQVTKPGLTALKRTRNLHSAIWDGVPETIFPE
ncbi:MAG: PadR family transcriptional regulator [bacterium]|nr:PadR family transcriptional regulator [bacterium]